MCLGCCCSSRSHSFIRVFKSAPPRSARSVRNFVDRGRGGHSAAARLATRQEPALHGLRLALHGHRAAVLQLERLVVVDVAGEQPAEQYGQWVWVRTSDMFLRVFSEVN